MTNERSLPGGALAGGTVAAAALLLWTACGGESLGAERPPREVALGSGSGTVAARSAGDSVEDVEGPGARSDADRLKRLLTVPPPDSVEQSGALATLRRGVELMDQGRPRSADDSLAAAARVLESARDWIGLGRARAAAVAGDTLRVRRLLAGLDFVPSPRWARSTAVTALDSAGAPDSAARAAVSWAEAAESREESSRALLRAGRLFAAAGEEERATGALRRSAEGAPWSDAALEAADELADRVGLTPGEELAAGRAYSAHGEWDRAHSRLGRYLSAAGEAAVDRNEVRLEYATALYRADRYLQAIRAAEGVSREEAPELAAEALVLEARGRLRYGGEADGVELLREAVRRHPDDPAAGEALAELASRAEEEGRRDEARRYWVRAARHAGSVERAELRLVRGAALAYMAGDHDSAAALFAGRTGAGTGLADRQRSLYWAGLAQRAAGREEESREMLADALRVDRFSYYGTRAAALLGRPLLSADLPPGPGTPGDLERELINALLRLRVAKALSLEGAVETEAGRLEAHFGRHPVGRYALAEAMNDGGFPIRGVRVAHRIRSEGEDPNLRLLRALYPFPYRDDIRSLASRRGLSPYLVAGLIRQESLFETEIESGAGAIGLMQIMPATGRDLARAHDVRDYRTDHLLRPSVNLRLGTGYLAELIDRFDGSLSFALAAYNAGPHRMSRWSRREFAQDLDVFLEGIPFRQTRRYVKAVQAHARIYAALYGCGSSETGAHEPCLGRQATLDLRPGEGRGAESATAR